MLAEAARTGEVVRIVYHGGSQPGTVREISPVSVTDVEMAARDMTTGAIKTFRLARIELPASGSSVRAYDPTLTPPAEDIRPLGGVLQGSVRDLEALKWHVQLSEDSVSLHRFFKNGKPRKIPDVELHYSEFIVETVIDFAEDEASEEISEREERRRSQHPYHLSSLRFASTRTFVKMSTAIAAFLDEARSLAPINTARSP
jgi:predicted DNA-binding transcriptional regulator YafY